MRSFDLVELIKKYPNCRFMIDNDYWWMEDLDDLNEEGEPATIIDCQAPLLVQRGDGYGSGNCYGGDILQALAEIVGIQIESV